MTSAGKDALQTELETLKSQRPKIAEELHNARADGDVRENAPLDAAREAQGQLEARIREIEATLQHAVISEETTPTGDAAHVGCSVTIANLTTGTQLSYQIVNAAEARPGTGKLSIESPVGKAIVGKRVGDEVQVAAPSGTIRFRIDRIET
jgi:transcription elongation factor GreA